VYVLDLREVIDDSTEILINDLCREVERKTTAEMAVLTVSSTGGEEPWLYAANVGEKWGVGQEGEDNGLIMVVAIDDREVFTATGTGMEAIIPDAVVDQIYRQVLAPRFRSEEYGEGILLALQLYAVRIGEYYEVEFGRTQGTPSFQESSAGVGETICVILFFIVWFGGFLGVVTLIILSIVGAIGKAKGKKGRFWSAFGSGSSSGSSGGGFSGGSFGGGGFSGGGGGGGW